MGITQNYTDFSLTAICVILRNLHLIKGIVLTIIPLYNCFPVVGKCCLPEQK